MTASNPASGDAPQTPESIRYTAYAAYARHGDLDAPADKATAELVDLVANWAARASSSAASTTSRRCAPTPT